MDDRAGAEPGWEVSGYRESLKAKLESLATSIASIEASGEVAPPRTWIQKYCVPKNGKKFYYYRLIEASEKKSKAGKVQRQTKQYLGNSSSELDGRCQAAIERRNQLQALQRQYERRQRIYLTLQAEGLTGNTPEKLVAEKVF